MPLEERRAGQVARAGRVLKARAEQATLQSMRTNVRVRDPIRVDVTADDEPNRSDVVASVRAFLDKPAEGMSRGRADQLAQPFDFSFVSLQVSHAGVVRLIRFRHLRIGELD